MINLKTYKNYINENIKLYDGLTEQEFFTKYLKGTELFCFNNNLTSLPELPSNLTNLSCSNNQLTSLPELPSTLISLYCSNNNLTSLPELPSTLKYLNCIYNDLPYKDLYGYKIWYCQTYPKKCKAREFNL